MLGYEAMENEQSPGRPKQPFIAHIKRHFGRTRLVMALLLIVAVPIFITLANRAVHENADAIRQVLGQ
jgi:hypothetical protein